MHMCAVYDCHPDLNLLRIALAGVWAFATETGLFPTCTSAWLASPLGRVPLNRSSHKAARRPCEGYDDEQPSTARQATPACVSGKAVQDPGTQRSVSTGTGSDRGLYEPRHLHSEPGTQRSVRTGNGSDRAFTNRAIFTRDLGREDLSEPGTVVTGLSQTEPSSRGSWDAFALHLILLESPSLTRGLLQKISGLAQNARRHASMAKHSNILGRKDLSVAGTVVTGAFKSRATLKRDLGRIPMQKPARQQGRIIQRQRKRSSRGSWDAFALHRILCESPLLTRGLLQHGLTREILGRICFLATKTVYYPSDCIICTAIAYSVNTMQKRARHDSILEMISAAPVRSQTELAEMLSGRGYRVTQASVSRDLDELGVTKIGGRYVRSVPSLDNGIAARATFETAGPHMIVGKCASGLASAITVRIDSMKLPEIVGTIAGDDTIMIAVRSVEAQSAALDRLTEMFGGQ
jgi:transcriptional regulator of arginine metabolism